MALRVLGGLRTLQPSSSLTPASIAPFTPFFTRTPNSVLSANAFHATSFRWRSEVREEKLRLQIREKIIKRLQDTKIDVDSEHGKSQLEASLAKFEADRRRLAERAEAKTLKKKAKAINGASRRDNLQKKLAVERWDEIKRGVRQELKDADPSRASF